MRAPLLAVLLLVAVVPVPIAGAQSAYSVDASLEPTSLGKATERHRFTYDGGSTRWTLLIPEGATFVRAFDGGGDLASTVSGSDLRVTSRSSPFTVLYERPLEAEGPLLRAMVQVASASNSPTTVQAKLPAGWALVGYRATGDLVMDELGVLRDVGPQSVDLLLAPPGVTDPGPDPRMVDDRTVREAIIDVTPTSASLRLTVVYDTDVYSPDWTVAIPTGATFRKVETPWGAVGAVVANGAATFTLPYPAGHHLGPRAFVATMDLAPPVPHGGSFRKVDANVAAGATDRVTVTFALAPGMTPTGILTNQNATATTTTVDATGPVAATLAFLPPAPSGAVRFTTGPFTVEAPASLEVAARAVVRNATEVLPLAAGFAGGANVTRPFFVAYTHEPVFDWEAGFYSPGFNTISIRADSLDNSTDGRARLEAVSVLVHETTHGLLDRLVQGGPSDLSMFQEGLARLAETNVELAFPDEVFECTRSSGGESCLRHSSRPDAAELQAFHREGRAFDPAWSTKTTTPEERSFLYDYSGLVFHAYEKASPEGALLAALADIARTPGSEDPASAATWVMDALLFASPDLSRSALAYPGREAAGLDPTDFRGCLGDLVAPGFPFDPKPTVPRDGCPVAPAPTKEERDALQRPATPTAPIVVVTPTAPTPKITSPPPSSPSPPRDVPAGVIESPSAPAPVPGAGVLVAVAAVALAALAARKK